MKFRTPIYHANVRSDGYFCTDILHSGWSSALSASTILLSVISLLNDPEADFVAGQGKDAEKLWEALERKRKKVYPDEAKNDNDFDNSAGMVEHNEEEEDSEGGEEDSEGGEDDNGDAGKALRSKALRRRKLFASDDERQRLFVTDPAAYKQKAKEWTAKFAVAT